MHKGDWARRAHGRGSSDRTPGHKCSMQGGGGQAEGAVSSGPGEEQSNRTQWLLTDLQADGHLQIPGWDHLPEDGLGVGARLEGPEEK